MAIERFLVTGSGGCIGAWVVAQLASEGVEVVAFDLSDDQRRLLLTGLDGTDRVTFRRGDIRDPDVVGSMVAAERITHIVHLAALQVPFCQADPILGSQVNVTGTVNVMEAARASQLVRGVTYASSIAVFGPAALYPGGVAGDDDLPAPSTLYGAYKRANEDTARVYAADWGIGSVGLRPCIVYGPGRDQGVTSDPTKAMLAAVLGEPFHIAFGGGSTYQHATDVAAYFVAAARVEATDAVILNVNGPSASVEEVVGYIVDAEPAAADLVTVGDATLPLPVRIEGPGIVELVGDLNRPLGQGVADTVVAFRRLAAAGLVEAAN